MVGRKNSIRIVGGRAQVNLEDPGEEKGGCLEEKTGKVGKRNPLKKE